MFSYTEERFNSVALELTYHLAPWDAPVFHANTAVLSAIRVQDFAQNDLRFNRTIVLFISDDFFRGIFHWPDDQLRCLHEITDCRTDYFYPTPPDDDILAVTARRAGREIRSLRSRLGYLWERYLEADPKRSINE